MANSPAYLCIGGSLDGEYFRAAGDSFRVPIPRVRQPISRCADEPIHMETYTTERYVLDTLRLEKFRKYFWRLASEHPSPDLIWDRIRSADAERQPSDLEWEHRVK